jgi:hypothetical protein
MVFMIIGALFFVMAGSACAGMFGGSAKGLKILEAIKGIIGAAILTLGIVLWVKTGDWKDFALVVFAGGILAALWDWGFNIGTRSIKQP